MKKNGFIATSILYSFFLVFLTLFLALVANYLHNQNLIRQVNSECKNKLTRINNLTFNDLQPGDFVKFKTKVLTDKELDCRDGVDEEDCRLLSLKDLKDYSLLNDNGMWVYAFSDDEYFYFFSSTDIVNDRIDNYDYAYMADYKNVNEKVLGFENDGYSLEYFTGNNLLLSSLEFINNKNDNNKIGLLSFEVLEGFYKQINEDNKKSGSEKKYGTLQFKNILNDLFDYREIVIVDFDNTSKKTTYYSLLKYNASKDETDNSEMFATCGVSPTALADEVTTFSRVDGKPSFSHVGVTASQNSGVITREYSEYISYCLKSSDEFKTSAPGVVLYLKINKEVKNNNIYAGSGTKNDAYLVLNGNNE